MTKRELLSQIKQAYIAHIKWRSSVQALHLGIPLYNKSIETDPKLTEFGKWYYGNGQIFSDVEIFKKMEVLNKRVHHIYDNICKLENTNKDTTFLSKFFIETTASPEDMKLAYFRDFVKQSKELLSLLKELESAIENS